MPRKKSPAVKRSHKDVSDSQPHGTLAVKTIHGGNVGFDEGDIVFEAGTTRVGRICSVVTPGLSYNVRFADDVQCSLMTQSLLVPAPGQPGPSCTPDC